MKTIVFLMFLGIAGALPISDDDSDDKIVGGYVCAKNAVPYQVSLQVGSHVCGGSLIRRQWVLSAAHCYKPSFQVKLGKHNLAVSERTEQIINSVKVIKHPGYNPKTLKHDIMLIKLARPAILNRSVRTIALPRACPVSGTWCLLSGWGSTRPLVSKAALGAEQTIPAAAQLEPDMSSPSKNNSEDEDRAGSKSSNVLRCLSAPVLQPQTCHWVYPGQIYSSSMCLGFLHGGKDTCKGDSGGGVACKGAVHGIVSWGAGCAQKGKPGVYTKVCKYLKWIRRTMAANRRS